MYSQYIFLVAYSIKDMISHFIVSTDIEYNV